MPTCRHDRAPMTGGLAVPAVRSGRIYNAPLHRATAARACRGGLNGRPNGLPIPAVLPPNVVKRKPGNSGGLVWRGVGTPPYGPGRWRVVGAASSRPNRLGIFTALSPNAVGRHAHMLPWPGFVNRKPWWFRRCGPGAYTMRPYNGQRRRVHVGAALMAARTGFRFLPYSRRTL